MSENSTTGTQQQAGYKNYPVPPNYDHIELPTERQKLKFHQKVPQYPGNIRPPKMTKRLDLIRGEEEIHRDLVLEQYGIIVRARRGGMLRHGHLEMVRMTIARKMDISKMFAIWRIDSPWKPITRKGQGKRMGGGKGSIDHYVTPIKAERVIIEIGGKCSFEEARPFLKMIAEKLPFPADAVSHKLLVQRREEEERLERENLNPYSFKYIVQNNMLGCHMWVKNIDKIHFGKYT
ncbi:39S ribosomal protein L16, mitochondrial [Chionoecetes opilio]|uniref:Large ribosomal subunit protein uL16m n=1 Tax=Chionoecetes opilio TaxID=41210 RepID=A0A8J4XPR8_CHIOP|nr:39S ribosomal protein L16, mitochondrial [Chionoecetes opilio]